MAEISLSLRVRLADLPQTKLLCWTLEELASEMRVGADPFAERLTDAIDRYQRSLPDGYDDEADDS